MTDTIREFGARLYARGLEPADFDLEAILRKAGGNIDLAVEITLATAPPPEETKPTKRRAKIRNIGEPTPDYAATQSDDLREAYMRQRWLELIPHPSVGLIVGQRRYGKTGLGYWLLELLSRAHSLAPYAIGLPSQKWHLIETHVRPLPPEEIGSLPEHAVALIDEAAIHLFARNWQSNDFADVVQRIISVSGQRKQTIIFISHNTRKFDVSVLADIDWMAYKMPNQFHARLEREKFGQLSQEALSKFRTIQTIEDQKRTAFFWGGTTEAERLTNPLPTFWSQDLSEAYAGLNIEGKPAEPPRPKGPPMKRLNIDG